MLPWFLGQETIFGKNGFRTVLIGLSGGIDSALTAAIAVDALGKKGVVGVTMPSQYSSKGSVEDSELLARNLGIRSHQCPDHRDISGLFKDPLPIF